ncbi:MAG: hypothetical protein ACI85I_001723 [Arenicella sp.]|jgi:hypothetical protein
MNLKFCLFIVLPSLFTTQVLSIDFKIEINGSYNDTIKIVDSLKPIKIRFAVENDANLKIERISVTHGEYWNSFALANKKMQMAGSFLETEYLFRASKIEKGNFLLFEIEYSMEGDTISKKIEHYKVIGDTKTSATKPYYLQIQIYDNGIELKNPSQYISLIKNWKETRVSEFLINHSKGESFGKEVGESKYTFEQIPDSLKLIFRYGYISETYELPTNYFKYGGLIKIGIVRNVKKAKKENLDKVATKKNMVSFFMENSLSGCESFICAVYERFPIGNGTRKGISHCIYLSRKERKKKIDK